MGFYSLENKCGKKTASVGMGCMPRMGWGAEMEVLGGRGLAFLRVSDKVKLWLFLSENISSCDLWESLGGSSFGVDIHLT